MALIHEYTINFLATDDKNWNTHCFKKLNLCYHKINTRILFIKAQKHDINLLEIPKDKVVVARTDLHALAFLERLH